MANGDSGLYTVWMEPREVFYARIDELGGWPPGKKYVAYNHTLDKKRPCKFMDYRIRDEWWTTVCSADDYYWWKLSDDRKMQHRNKVLKDVSNDLLIAIGRIA